MSAESPSARDGALQQLMAEAARFSQETPPDEAPATTRRRTGARRPQPTRPVAVPTDTDVPATPDRSRPSAASSAGYVPVAVAPERGNTRPVVPVDGRLHMRVAQPTLDALDDVVRSWKADRPERRDLERATLVRIGLAMVLADVREHGQEGAVAEAVRAALDPGRRHTDTPMPELERWITPPAGS